MTDQPVWVTGAGGLIGSHIIRHAASIGKGTTPKSDVHEGHEPLPVSCQLQNARAGAEPCSAGVLAGEFPHRLGARTRNPSRQSGVHGKEIQPVIGLTRAQLDLTDSAAVRRAFRERPPRLIIHCAALSKSTACQENPALARLLNIEVTARLAELAADIPFLFFSTDLVFDGQRGNYVETDAVNPLSIYGETKVAAERIVLANPRHTVIRTSLNAGVSPTRDRAFNEEMRRAWDAGRALRLFVDEFRSPIPVAVTARAVWELAAHDKPGLYHLAGAERLSRWQIGQLLVAKKSPPVPKLEPGSLAEYQGAPRPPDTSLNCEKVQALLSFPLPRFSAWMAEHPGEI